MRDQQKTPLTIIREFIKLESSAGIILFLAAVIALIISNTRLESYYHAFFNAKISISVGAFVLAKPLLHWINDGFMSIFFLLIGLEVKRELFEGELNSLSKAMLPAIAALGGMVFPALIYLHFNYANKAALQGWAIPVATDIAFALGILSLLGKRIPVGLKTFLLATAIFDDLGAIIVIALFYTAHISLPLLFVSLLMVIILLLMNRFRVSHLGPYFVVGVILWVCVLKSGIHATLAGVILAFAIPLKKVTSDTGGSYSMSALLEHRLHPWVAFGILPLFAFANAGVSFSGITLQHFLNPIPLGIALGLFLGKQIGIWCATILSVRFGVAKFPDGVTPIGLYGVSLLAGVGFTMSLFIGGLAFSESGEHAAFVRLGVLGGSLIAGLAGYLVLRFAYKRPETAESVSIK